MSDFLRYEQTGGVVTLTLNDPASRNALSTPEQWAAVVDAAERVLADLSVRCVILTGAGSAFCAGGNVKDMQNKTGIAAGDPNRISEGYRNGIQRIPLAFHRLDVPTIAAVNGPAVGAGCDLACMCDIRIAGESARFAESFVKLGIIPGDGGAWLLPRVVGMSRAAEMTFTGEMIDAAEGYRLGAIEKVVPREQLRVAAREIAAKIAAKSPAMIRLAKEALTNIEDGDLEHKYRTEQGLTLEAYTMKDSQEARDAFVQKRDAKF